MIALERVTGKWIDSPYGDCPVYHFIEEDETGKQHGNYYAYYTPEGAKKKISIDGIEKLMLTQQQVAKARLDREEASIKRSVENKYGKYTNITMDDIPKE